MKLYVNGELRELASTVTVADLVPGRRGYAVALNGEVVPRSRWPATALHEGDRVEILEAAQGG